MATGSSGTARTTSRSTFAQVTSGVLKATGGYYHTLVMKSDGKVWGAGSNASGELGDGTMTLRSSFEQIPAP